MHTTVITINSALFKNERWYKFYYVRYHRYNRYIQVLDSQRYHTIFLCNLLNLITSKTSSSSSLFEFLINFGIFILFNDCVEVVVICEVFGDAIDDIFVSLVKV